MNCPKCGKPGTRVMDSRCIEEGQFRRRICQACGYEFYTEEYEADSSDGLKACWAEIKRRKRNESLYGGNKR